MHLQPIDQEQLWFPPEQPLRGHWTVKTERRTFTWRYLGCFSPLCSFFFVQQNISSEGLPCMAGVLLIVIVVLWVHVLTLVVRPLSRVGPGLHRAVGVHQNGLEGKC